MKMPVLLIGAVLMFWGWQTDMWILALVMALIFEGSRLIRLRWDLSARDFKRISNGCTILFILLLIYISMSQRTANFIVVVIQWFPIVFFPLLAGQAYSTSERIDIRTLFLFWHRKNKDKHQKRTPLNLTYPYFVVCVVSAGAANVRDSSFYVGVLVLSALALWVVRSKRFSAVLWIGVMFIAAGAGLIGHIGLHGLQLVLEQKGLEWTSDFTAHDPDPFQTHTAIGDIGALKPSDRIIFRVKPQGQKASPMLLRETTYNRYLSPMWVAVEPDFKPLKPVADTTSWRIHDGPAAGSMITVSAYLHKGQGVLKLPDGAFLVDRLPVVTVQRNKYGTVKVEGEPGLVAYRVQFDDGIAGESPPTESDLVIPDKEKSAINSIHDRLQLSGKSPRHILKQIESFFQNDFRYSLTLSGGRTKKSPLEVFLLQSRAGHCEYFATATVLLLRAAGIPARYARGYSVHEFSRLENRFVVRNRHAHAWTRVYLDGAWHNFDTTPGTWTSIEDAASPRWQVFSDLGSWCWFQLLKALWWVRQSSGVKYLWWLILPVVFIPARFLIRKKRTRRPDSKKTSQTNPIYTRPGTDSDFYLIEKALIKAGFDRNPTETLRNWIGRMPENQSASHLMDDLESILKLHYRYRFDPQGISPAEKEALTSTTRTWLNEYHKIAQSG
jgi:transglutaminase-like putative cysteine protease